MAMLQAAATRWQEILQRCEGTPFSFVLFKGNGAVFLFWLFSHRMILVFYVCKYVVVIAALSVTLFIVNELFYSYCDHN